MYFDRETFERTSVICKSVLILSKFTEMNKVQKQIIKTLKDKSETKQLVYDHTLKAFKILKEELQKMVAEINENLKKCDKRVLLEYKDRGDFEAEIKVAGDILVFNMHTNIFEFENSHNIWKTTYVKKNRMNSYSGVINIYNFLSDSFKYNRLDDLGYLIGRLFVNKDEFFFVEGKHQMGFVQNDFGNIKIDREHIKDVIDAAIQYSLEFDLLVPPYRHVEQVTVAQMKDRINKSKTSTGKRLGFQFYSQDDEVV